MRRRSPGGDGAPAAVDLIRIKDRGAASDLL
jgi:hypothetical protein